MSAFDFSSFLIIFRETLEAAIIVGIVFTFLLKMKAERYYKLVTVSTAAAIACSLAAAYAVELVLGTFDGRPGQIFEGVVCLIATVVLTYMVFWMHRQSARLRSNMENHLASAMERQDVWAVVSLPFFAVLREGVESVLFLKAAAVQANGAVSLLGGFVGFVLAVAIAYVIFIMGKRVPLKPFFKFTGVLLLFISGGLLAYGVHELEEAGIINPIIYPLWNINSLLNEKQGIGSFIKAIFGYNGNPSLVETSLYFSYLSVMIFFMNQPEKKPAVTVRGSADPRL